MTCIYVYVYLCDSILVCLCICDDSQEFSAMSKIDPSIHMNPNVENQRRSVSLLRLWATSKGR